MKRSPLRRRRPRRIGRESVFAPYVAFIHRLGASCVVCGTTVNIQGSHVGQGGMGMKHGKAADMVPMCGPGANGCHQQWEERRLYFRDWPEEQRRRFSLDWRVSQWRRYVAQAPLAEVECIRAIVFHELELNECVT